MRDEVRQDNARDGVRQTKEEVLYYHPEAMRLLCACGPFELYVSLVIESHLESFCIFFVFDKILKYNQIRFFFSFGGTSQAQ